MQAALVLFGYDIEQQIKKIYKRPDIDGSGDNRYQSVTKRRFHNILWPAIRDIRG